MKLPLTRKQADLLYRLVDAYLDSVQESIETSPHNRSDIGLSRRIRNNLAKMIVADRGALRVKGRS